MQRVLRYPLFLKAMKDKTTKGSDEQIHLIGIYTLLTAMNYYTSACTILFRGN